MIGKFFLVLSPLLALAFAGCEDQKTFRDTVNQQNDAFASAKRDELAPAEGTYVGTMRLNKSNQPFDCVIVLKRTNETTRVSGSQDPTETVQVPKLGGSMHFPALDETNATELPELAEPLGGFSRVTFDFGDYNPRQGNVVLPYSITGYSQGAYGEIDGTLKSGHLTGTWFAKAFGDVGSFDLVRQTGGASAD